MRSTTTLCAALWLAACGGGTQHPASSSPPATTPPPSTPPPAPPVASAPYEVHEWGLVDVPEGGGPAEIAAGPGPLNLPMAVRKPVLYVHLLDGATEQRFDAHVALASGTVFEHWPAGTVSGATLDWTGVVAHAAHCGGGVAATRESPLRMNCGTPDGVCEVTELPRYDAPSSACLDVAGAPASLLFYRGGGATLRLPVTATRRADMKAVVTASASLAGAPGEVWRLSTAMSGPWPPGHVVISRAPLPAAGQSVELAVGTTAVSADDRAALATAATRLGLTQDEAAAFVAAWGDELFGPDPRGPVPARDQIGRWSTPRVQDVILVWLPPGSYDGISTLRFDPAPRVVKRAFIVRINLGGVSTG